MVRIIRHRHRRHAVVTTEDGDNCVPRTRVNKAFAVMPTGACPERSRRMPASVVFDTTDPATVCGVTIAYRECGGTGLLRHSDDRREEESSNVLHWMFRVAQHDENNRPRHKAGVTMLKAGVTCVCCHAGHSAGIGLHGT